MFLMQRRQTQPIKLIQCYPIVTCRIKLSWGYSLTLVYLDVCFLGKPAHVTVVGLANSTCTQYMIVRLVMKCVVDYNIHVHVWYMHPGFSCTSLMIPIIKHCLLVVVYEACVICPYTRQYNDVPLSSLEGIHCRHQYRLCVLLTAISVGKRCIIHVLVIYVKMCGAHGSEVIGVRPETRKTLVQAPLQFLDVCCTLRQGTLPTLCQCNQLKLGISICWELMDWCFIQGAQLGMSTSLLGLHNLNKDLTIVLAECYKKLSQQQNLKPNCQQQIE